YTLHNFKIPFFPRINNAIDLTINASYNQDIEQKYVLSSDLDNALQGFGGLADVSDINFTSSFTSGQDRIRGSAILGYHFSQAVKATFEYNYLHLIPKSTGI